MNYFYKFDEEIKKMENLLIENGLLFVFDTESYPLTMTIQPNTTPDEQMAMFKESTDGVSSQDAKLVLQFPVGEIVVRVYGERLVISDYLLNKIKNQAKKLHYLWLQGHFATYMERKKNSAG